MSRHLSTCRAATTAATIVRRLDQHQIGRGTGATSVKTDSCEVMKSYILLSPIRLRGIPPILELTLILGSAGLPHLSFRVDRVPLHRRVGWKGIAFVLGFA